MTHIANCMKRGFSRMQTVYLMEETPAQQCPSTGLGIFEPPACSAGLQGDFFPKYQLWPRPPSRAPPSPLGMSSYDHKSMALAVGRSSSSLSDTAVTHDIPVGWRLGGSLARRRNISVPELTNKIDQSTRTTYHDSFADSPTIPGRPALRKVASEMIHHERSSSVPGSWRDCPFGDAMVSGVAWPKINDSVYPIGAQWATPMPVREAPVTFPAAFNPTRPLSPIFSPVEATTPTTAVPRSPVSPQTPPDVPPKVPPKTTMDGGSPISKIILKPKPSRGWLKSSPSKQNLKTAPERPVLTRSGSRSNVKPVLPTLPVMPVLEPSPTLSSCATLVSSPSSKGSPGTNQPISASSSPISRSEGRTSPGRISPNQSQSPSTTAPTDVSIMERPRAVKRTHKKSTSLSYLVKPYETDLNGLALPTGMRPMEAVMILPDEEKESLRQQALGQAEQFEVLGAKHVSDMSRELRALDERCEYLRKTYKSLRAGRQKLHTRMISYLKSESLIFSRERLLKQQEALIELDRSVDDWILKLERAENRRLRLRQKLLEHVAAAMALSTSYQQAQNHPHYQATTPPRSPTRAAPPPPSSPAVMVIESPKPLRVDRKEVESIKIYADNHVLNLFNDIEQAVTKMCEAC